MGSINYGNQQISIEYNERLRAAEANELLADVLRPGVISWPQIASNEYNLEYLQSNTPTVEVGPGFNGNEIIIKPFTVLLPAYGAFNERMVIKVRTNVDISLDGTGIPTVQNLLSTNTVYIKYDWIEGEGNFADVVISKSSNLIPPNAVVLAVYLTDKFGTFSNFSNSVPGGISAQIPANNQTVIGGPVLADAGDNADYLSLKIVAGNNISTIIETNPVPPTSIYFGSLAQYKQLRIDSLDEKVKITPNDTTPSDLISKLTSDSNFVWNLLNPGGNEQLQLTFNGALQFDKIKITGADTVNGYLFDSIQVDSNLSKSVQNPGADETLLISNLRPGHRIVDPGLGIMPQRWNFSLFGYGFSLVDNGLGNATELTLGARTQSHAPIIATHSLDLSTHEVHYVDLAGVPSSPITFTLNGVGSTNGKTILIRLTQGPIPVNIAFTNTIKWRGGPPTFTVTPNAIDLISIYSDGVDLYGITALNFI